MRNIKPISIKIKRDAWKRFFSVVMVTILGGYLLSLINFRVDLTGDKRYTLSPQTKEILSGLKDDVYLQVYLDGEMPVQFKKMRRSVRDILDEFKVLSHRHVGYDFINPSEGNDIKQRNNRQIELSNKGLAAVNVQAGDDEGGTTTKVIFPGMIVNYNGIEVPVNFLNNNQTLSGEQNISNSIEGLEYEIIQTISTLVADTIYKVAFIEGHGELDEYEVADITLAMAKFFTIDRGVIGGRPGILDNYSAIIIAAPTEPFDEKDKFVIDQYIMNGGRVLWLADMVYINPDSLNMGETMAVYKPLGIGDQLFRYGARINPVLVQDIESMVIPMKAIGPNGESQMISVKWPWYPLLTPSVGHPVTRNLNRIKSEFVNSIDTVGLDPAINKTILLTTSQYSKISTPPFIISLSEAGLPLHPENYNRGRIPVAVLLEGVFRSVYRNRMISGITEGRSVKQQSIPTKMIVVADGDLIRNDVSYASGSPVPLTLGKDRYTDQIFGNKDFLVNCLNYLVNDNGLMELRSRELKLRLINKPYVKGNIFIIRLINILLPVLLVALAGIIYGVIRRKRYTFGQ